jgi:hypothetical protein
VQLLLTVLFCFVGPTLISIIIMFGIVGIIGTLMIPEFVREQKSKQVIFSGPLSLLVSGISCYICYIFVYFIGDRENIDICTLCILTIFIVFGIILMGLFIDWLWKDS